MAIIKRKPSSTVDEDMAASDEVIGETIDNEPIELVGEQAPDRKPAIEDNSRFSDQEKSATARMFTGAAPALMGLLFGASPLTAENQIKEGQSFYAGGVPKKTVLTRGPNGEPIYTDVRESIGKEAWAKPVAAKSGPGMSPITYKNAQGLEAIGFADKARAKVIDTSGNVIENPVKYQAPKYQEVTDERGNKKIIAIGPTSDVNTIANTASGLGAKYNLREDEVKSGDKLAEIYTRDAKPIYDSKVSLKGAMQLLNAPDADAITQAAGIFRTAKAIVNERISDQERGVVTLPPGLTDKLSQQIELIATNKNPQEQLRQLRAVLIELDKANDLALSSMQDRYVNQFSNGGSDKSKAKYLSDKIVSSSGISVGSTPKFVRQGGSPSAPMVPKSPQMTREQFNALTPVQQKAEIDKIRRIKGKI